MDLDSFHSVIFLFVEIIVKNVFVDSNFKVLNIPEIAALLVYLKATYVKNISMDSNYYNFEHHILNFFFMKKHQEELKINNLFLTLLGIMYHTYVEN